MFKFKDSMLLQHGLRHLTAQSSREQRTTLKQQKCKETDLCLQIVFVFLVNKQSLTKLHTERRRRSLPESCAEL